MREITLCKLCNGNTVRPTRNLDGSIVGTHVCERCNGRGEERDIEADDEAHAQLRADNARLTAERDAAKAEAARLRAAFESYGQHDAGCSAALAQRYKCKCGYDLARAALDAKGAG